MGGIKVDEEKPKVNDDAEKSFGDVEDKIESEAEKTVDADADAEISEAQSNNDENVSDESVESVDEAKAVEDTETEMVEAEVAETEVQQDVKADDLVANSINSNNTQKKSHKGVFALVAVLVLAAAGCAGAYFLTQNPEKRADTKGGSDEESKEVSELRMDGNGLSDFDLKFLKLENKKSNIIYSPLSIKYALAMLKDGADGDSKQQIEDVIGDYKPKKYLNSRNISLANAMFIRDINKDNILDSYITGLKDNYNADVVYDSFTSADVMNKWVSNKTLGLINGAIRKEDLEDLSYALVNALAIDQKWEHLLQCQVGNKRVPCMNENVLGYHVKYAHEKYLHYVNNVDGDDSFSTIKFGDYENRKVATIGASFNNYDIIKELGEDKIRAKVAEEYKKWLKGDGSTAIDAYREDKSRYDIDPSNVTANVDQYMKELKANYGREDMSTDFYMNTTDDVKVFAKDLQKYDGNTLQYVGIMPKTESLEKYVENLKAEEVSELISGLKELKKENFKDGVVTQVNASIPFFKYDYNMENFKEDLQEIGIEDVFDQSKANLSKMSKDSTYIKVAKHAATIEFSNEGIKAGAVTMMGGAGSGGLNFEYEWDVPVEKIDLSFNNPYMYLIRDKDSGEIWFAGMVYKPVEGTKKSD